MGVLKVTVTAEWNGKPIAGFDPYVYRTELDELRQIEDYPKPNDGDTTTFTAPPGITGLNTIQFFAIQPQAEITERHDNQSDGGTVIGAKGLLMGINVTIDAATLLSLNNNSGAAADVDLAVGGT